MEKKNKAWYTRWYVICIYVFFGIMLLSSFMGNNLIKNVNDCSVQYDKIDEQQKTIDNLEEGLIRYCEFSKVSATSTLANIDLLESLGYYSASEYKLTFKDLENQDCIQIVNDWKNK